MISQITYFLYEDYIYVMNRKLLFCLIFAIRIAGECVFYAFGCYMFNNYIRISNVSALVDILFANIENIDYFIIM